MTRRETVNALRREAEKGNYDALYALNTIEVYIPRILDYPETASEFDVNRYNSLIRANIESKRLQDELVII